MALFLYAGETILFEDDSKEYAVGMVDMSLPSKKTPYQVLIERFIRA